MLGKGVPSGPGWCEVVWGGVGCAHDHVALATNSGRWVNTTPSSSPPAPHATPRPRPDSLLKNIFSVDELVQMSKGSGWGRGRHATHLGAGGGHGGPCQPCLPNKNKAKTDKKEMGRKLVENPMCTVQGACHPYFFSRAVAFMQGLPTAGQVTQAEVAVDNLSGIALQSTHSTRQSSTTTARWNCASIQLQPVGCASR